MAKLSMSASSFEGTRTVPIECPYCGSNDWECMEETYSESWYQCMNCEKGGVTIYEDGGREPVFD